MNSKDKQRLEIEISNIRASAEAGILEIQSRILAGESLDDILASKATSMTKHTNYTVYGRLSALELASMRVEKLIKYNNFNTKYLINNLL